MDIEELVAKLEGRQEGDEMVHINQQELKEAGIVVVFGYSDDNTELRGAINDEIGTFDGGTILVTGDGLFEDCDEECVHSRRAKEDARVIKVTWGKGDWTWMYETDIPHKVFHIYDDDEKFCEGIIFKLSDVSA